MESVKLPFSNMNFIGINNTVIEEIHDEYNEDEKLKLFEKLEDIFLDEFMISVDFVKSQKKKSKRFTDVDSQIEDRNIRTLKEIEQDLESIQRYKDKAKGMIKRYVNQSLKSVIEIKKETPSEENLDNFYKNYIKMSQSQIKCLKAVNDIYLKLLEKESTRVKIMAAEQQKEFDSLKLLFES